MPSAGRVAVIGGTGFIGRRVVDQLLGDGRRVVVVSRRGSPARSGALGCEQVRGSVADGESMMAAIEGASEVIHMSMGGGARWADFERDFIQGTQNVARACRYHGVTRLVYVSSIAALDLGGSGTIDESTGADRRSHQRAFYSRAKGAAERLLDDLARAESLPVVILRPGVVVGRGGMLNHSGVGLWVNDLWCLGWGRGDNPLPFVLVDDVADAIRLACSAPGIEGRAFNLAGDVRPTAREYMRILSGRSLRNYRFYSQSLLKMQAVEVVKWMLKCAARKADNPFPSYHDLKSRSLRTQLDCRAAKELLGWKPSADPEHFVREAVLSHIRPVPEGDLRLAASRP